MNSNKITNMNEELNRIKSLFTEENLYGNKVKTKINEGMDVPDIVDGGLANQLKNEPNIQKISQVFKENPELAKKVMELLGNLENVVGEEEKDEDTKKEDIKTILGGAGLGALFGLFLAPFTAGASIPAGVYIGTAIFTGLIGAGVGNFANKL